MRALAAVAVLALVAACQAPPAEMSEAEMAQREAEVAQAIADRWNQFAETIQAGDYDRWVTFWTADARVLQPGTDLSGAAWLDAARSFFEGGMRFLSFEVESFDVFAHGDVAYQIGQYDETAELAGGEPAEWHEYLFVRWVRETDGMWRISRLLSAPREAPPEG